MAINAMSNMVKLAGILAGGAGAFPARFIGSLAPIYSSEKPVVETTPIGHPIMASPLGITNG